MVKNSYRVGCVMKYLTLIIALLPFVGCQDERLIYRSQTCSVTETFITCPDGSTFPLPQDGADGVDGTIVELSDPCGPHGGVDEVVLEFPNDVFLAWYKDVGFTVLEHGVAYITTDGQSCQFTITNGEVVEL